MFLKTLKRAASHFYDDLGRCVLINILWFLISSIGAGLILPFYISLDVPEEGPLPHLLKYLILPLLSLAVTAPPATAGVFYYANQLMRFEYPDTKAFFRGMRKYALRAWGLGVVSIAVIALLTMGIFIYLTYMTVSLGLLAYLLASISVWILVCFLAIQVFAWTFLVHQNTTVWKALQKGALVFLMRPFSAMGLLLLCAFITVLNFYLSLIALVLFQTSFIALLGNGAVLTALDEYPAE